MSTARHLSREVRHRRTIDSVIRAMSTDEDLSGLLHLAVCQSGDDSEKCLVVMTTKILHFYEPVKHISWLRLVLSGDGNYYIQVNYSIIDVCVVYTRLIKLHQKI